MYDNPVIPGFYPDPSVCRVGEDYYLPLVGGTDGNRDWPEAGSLGRLPDRVVQAHRQ